MTGRPAMTVEEGRRDSRMAWDVMNPNSWPNKLGKLSEYLAEMQTAEDREAFYWDWLRRAFEALPCENVFAIVATCECKQSKHLALDVLAGRVKRRTLTLSGEEHLILYEIFAALGETELVEAMHEAD